MGGTYEDLEAWQAAMELVVQIYAATKSFPPDERYGLTNQLRRAAVSVSSNIAEGKGRVSDKELLQFLSRARGSLYEVQTQVRVAVLLNYVTRSEAATLIQCGSRVGCLINGLMRSLKKLA
jgi:four helix bundle protein